MRPRKSILFLALSGVRIHNPGLRQLGLSLPAFAERGRTIAELPSLGLLTLAALTPGDWEMTYQEIDALDEPLIAEITHGDYSVIAISALTARILDAYRLADQLRLAGKTVILGGLHVTATPAEATQYADAIVVGEAEAVWPALMADIDSNRLQKIYRANASFDFSHAPLPRYDLLQVENYNRLSIQTTRGCPLDCEFCGASRLISRYKRKPVELIRRDLEAVLSRWSRPFIELADDNTFVNRDWSYQLARMFAEFKFRWFTETDISVADDEHLLDLLAESGCAQLLIGLESASPASLHQTDSRGWKERRFESYLRDIERIQQRGISVNGCFTLGLDGESESDFLQTRDFIKASGLAHVQVTLLTPFPGTELFRRLQNENRILPGSTWDQYTLFDVVYQPSHMSPGELRQSFHWLVSELYNTETAGNRTAAFRGYMKEHVQRKKMERFA